MGVYDQQDSILGYALGPFVIMCNPFKNGSTLCMCGTQGRTVSVLKVMTKLHTVSVADDSSEIMAKDLAIYGIHAPRK